MIEVAVQFGEECSMADFLCERCNLQPAKRITEQRLQLLSSEAFYHLAKSQKAITMKSRRAAGRRYPFGELFELFELFDDFSANPLIIWPVISAFNEV